MSIQLTALSTDHGSIVQFDGHDEGHTDRLCIVSCDHRSAQYILAALEADEIVLVDPEDWAVRWLS